MAIKEPAAAKGKAAASKDLMAFSFSDTIAGYVKRYDRNADEFTLETSDGRLFTVGITATTGAQVVHNLGEPYVDATGQMRDMLVPGRYLFTYGVFYPENGKHVYDAFMITFPGARTQDFVFEKPDWWVKQIWHMADFYHRVEFPEGVPNWREYRDKVQMKGRTVGGAHLTLTESVRHDRRRRLTIFEQVYRERRRGKTTEHRFDLTFRTLPIPQMAKRLTRAGFSIEAVLGDYRGKPWDDRAEVWIILARRHR